MIAIIPAAGLGKRMADITGGGPKELLMLGRRSVLRRVVDEALDAGAEEVVIVSSPLKPQIEDAVAMWNLPVCVAYQGEPRGWAHAVFSAGVQQDALILLGDCVMRGGSPLERMGTLIYRGIEGAIAVEQIPDAEVRQYGICEVDEMGGIRRILEKPDPSETESRWAVAARFALSAPLLGQLAELYLHEFQDKPDVPLTLLLRTVVERGADIKAVALMPNQERVDAGTPDEYRMASRLTWD